MYLFNNLWLQEDSEYSTSGTESEPEARGDVQTWCTCRNCKNMDSYRERVCCNDLEACVELRDDACVHYKAAKPFDCITKHPGFEVNCLRWEVLEVAWRMYKRQYGADAYESENKNKRYRHVAYRQLACFLFGSVGRLNRFILPACAVNKIRERFSNTDEAYTGFLFE